MKIPDELLAVAQALGELREKVVFVGGMTRGVLVSDPAVAGPRPTKDVDVIIDVPSPLAFSKWEEQLARLGFQPDLSDDAPICRRVLRRAGPQGDDLPVDFMPLDPTILGFSNAWYPEAYNNPTQLQSPAGTLLVIDGPHFLATKLESFASRGNGDYYHHDIEDIVVLIDGRPELVTEVRNSPPELRAFVSSELKRLLQLQDFVDALPGHLAPDRASQARLPLLRSRLSELTSI